MKQFKNNFHIFVLFILVIAVSSPSLLSGIQSSGKIFLHTGHDVLWHMSVAAEVKRGFPLIYPAMNGLPLTNYHYFTDLSVGIINLVFRLPLIFVYYKVLPLLFISALVWRIYKLSFILTKDRFASLTATVSSLIGGSAAFLLPLLINKTDWQGGAFMLSPTYTQLVNPHSILGFVLFFWGIYYVALSQSFGKYNNLFKASIIFSILFAIKSFYAIPSLAAVGLLSLINFSKKKDLKFIIPPIASLIIVSCIYLIISNGQVIGKGSPAYRPMWLLLKMVEQNNRFPLPDFILKRQHYNETNNIFRLILQNLQLLLLFLVGNFWVKILGIYFLAKSRWKKELKLFFVSLISLSLIIILAFVPEPDNYNAMQFGRVATILSSWLFGLFVGLKHKKIAAIAAVVVISTTFWLEFPKYTKTSGLLISISEYESLSFIRENTPLKSVVLVDTKKGNNNPLITGLGERRTYFDDYKTTQLLGLDYSKRSELQNEFFSEEMDKAKANDFLQKARVDYVYYYKPSQESTLPSNNLQKVFENESSIIYKVGEIKSF